MTPRVLVISNECFSQSSSNGRTLGNFLLGWPKECLAQFFLLGNPDNYYCNQYFQVSDRQAVNALLCRGNIGGIVLGSPETEPAKPFQSQMGEKRPNRNALTMLARNAIWNSGAWQKSGFWRWVEDYKPDIVLLQAGDFAFMYHLALKTAHRTGAEMVIYNSEAYCYKDFDYFQGKGLAHLVYPIFHKQLRRSLEKAYAIADCVIYACDELREQYAQDFSGRSETVFTGSEIQYVDKAKKSNTFTTVYCGNLGLKRHESLLDVGSVLQSISENLYVDVYGKAPSEEVAKALNYGKGIRYHGVIPYEQVKQIFRDSDLLLHVESFDTFYRDDLKFGFSTKIADCLSSGNCFLLYAPESMACFSYLKRNQAAYAVSDKETLKKVLEKLVRDPIAQIKYRETALRLAEKNHRVEKSSRRFQDLLKEVVR